MSMTNSQATLDPFLYLALPSPAQSICFVGGSESGKFSDLQVADDGSSNFDFANNSDIGSDSDSDSSEELEFRSSIIARHQNQKHVPRQELMKGRLLVSCHKNSDVLLWDCGRQSNISTIVGNRQGAGLAVKRIDGSTGVDSFMYQSRDPKGTVSIHALCRLGSGSMMKDSIVRNYETYSATFCQAAPCREDAHLIALPSRQESTATVMDDRDPVPVYATSPVRNYGMVTSLAMTMTTSKRPILACGMENGSVLFHDFSSGRSVMKGECNLTKDPILALDLVPSQFIQHDVATLSPSVVAVAGMAGDTMEVADLPDTEKGRIALLKAKISETEWDIRTRARLSTCRVDERFSFGKPGVAICRFRPGDARIFAVGGWDNRVRLFERSKGAPIGILRGHTSSVNSLDWAPDANVTGLLVTAADDDCTISFWKCFPRSQ